MIAPERRRMYWFIAAAVVVAAAVQFAGPYFAGNDDSNYDPKPKVSKGDIRRVVRIPISSVAEDEEKSAGFWSEMNNLGANAVMLDIPLHYRDANPAYIEYNRFQSGTIDRAVREIHAAGMEAILAPCLTGDDDAMAERNAREEAFAMYSEWLTDHAGMSADGLTIDLSGLFASVSASQVQSAMMSVYESYQGKVYLCIAPSKTELVRLFAATAGGFILDLSNGTPLPQTMTGALDSAGDVKAMILFHRQRTHIPDVFAPYVAQSNKPQKTDLSPALSTLEGVASNNWFMVMILQAPEYGTPSQQRYLEEVGTAFRELKERSIRRAFDRMSAPSSLR